MDAAFGHHTLALMGVPVPGGLRVAWPERASGKEAGMHEEVVREVTVSLGLVANKVCAIDETGPVCAWSGDAKTGVPDFLWWPARFRRSSVTGAKGLVQLPNRPPGDFGQVRPASLEPSRLERGIQPQRRGQPHQTHAALVLNV